MIVYEKYHWIILFHDVMFVKNFIMDHSMRLLIFNKFVTPKLLSIAKIRFSSTIVMFKKLRVHLFYENIFYFHFFKTIFIFIFSKFENMFDLLFSFPSFLYFTLDSNSDPPSQPSSLPLYWPTHLNAQNVENELLHLHWLTKSQYSFSTQKRLEKKTKTKREKKGPQCLIEWCFKNFFFFWGGGLCNTELERSSSHGWRGKGEHNGGGMTGSRRRNSELAWRHRASVAVAQFAVEEGDCGGGWVEVGVVV